MKIKDYLEEVEQLRQKILVYREIKLLLDKYLKTDTSSEPEQYIPIGAPIIDNHNLSYEKVVPQGTIADVFLEIEDAISKLEREYERQLEKELS